MLYVDQLAELVDSAAHTATAINQLSAKHSLSLTVAYDIQYASVARRKARGEKIIGLKMGFTSKAKAEQMGVHELIYGWLTDRMLYPSGAEIPTTRFIHPRVEPELAVRLAKPLSGEPDLEETWDAVECVAPAIEVIDSRYENFKFSLEDVVADNSSSSGLVLGEWQDKPADPNHLNINLYINDELIETGSTFNVMGNPIIAISVGARLLSERNLKLEPGWIVMTGGATAAAAITPGNHIHATVDSIGKVSFSYA